MDGPGVRDDDDTINARQQDIKDDSISPKLLQYGDCLGTSPASSVKQPLSRRLRASDATDHRPRRSAPTAGDQSAVLSDRDVDAHPPPVRAAVGRQPES
jgi:hypothetical protein